MSSPYSSQYPAPQGVPPVQPPVKKKRGWIPWVVAGALGLTFGAALGGGGDSTVTAAPEVTVTATETVEAPTPDEPTEDPTTKAPKPKEKSGPASVLEEGTSEVGVDVKPGRYKGKVPEDSFGCYWEISKKDSGELDDIIANDNVDSGGRVSLSVKDGQFVKVSGCGTLKRQ